MTERTTQSLVQPNMFRSFLLGIVQILLWGGSFFLLAVLAKPIVRDTGWSSHWVYGSLSLALLLSGCLAPLVGKQIANHGGHQLLLASGFMIGFGVMILGFAPSLIVFVLGWCVIGLGMAIGLYDALFATLGKQYGSNAKVAIVQVTLVSGLCTTVVWPLLGLFVEHWSWRGACVAYGALLWLCLAAYKARIAHAPSKRPIGNASCS